MEAQIPEEDELAIELGHEDETRGYVVRSKKARAFFGPSSDGPVKFSRGMSGMDGRLEKMAALIMQGESARAIRRKIGGSLMTIVKLRRVLEILTGAEVLCPCGRTVRSHVWCEWREANSSGRQAYLQRCAELSAKKSPPASKTGKTENSARKKQP